MTEPVRPLPVSWLIKDLQEIQDQYGDHLIAVANGHRPEIWFNVRDERFEIR